MNGFLRLASCVPELRVGDPSFNAARILELYRKAEAEGAAIAVFPELSVTGYTCGDLFENRALLAAAERELLALARAYLPACRRSFRSFLGNAAMWKTAIVCITLLAAQNLCAAETNGWYMVFFVEILLAIAAAVGLAVAVAYVAGCFGNEVEEEVETEEDESISR